MSGTPAPTVTAALPTTTGGEVDRSQVTSQLWAELLIDQLQSDGYDVPNTTSNQQLLMRWIQVEGGSGGGWLANNDPLNATANETGAFTYPSVADGIAQTAGMIEQQNMAPILATLMSGNASTLNFSQALNSTPWDGSVAYSDKVAKYGANWLAAFPATLLYGTGTGGNPDGELGQLTNAAEKTGALGVVGAALSGAGTLADLEALAAKGLADLEAPTWWKRVGVGAGGVVLFVVGLVLFISTTKTGQKVTSDASTVAMA